MSLRSSKTTERIGTLLTRPAVLGAVAVLLFNDHVAKGSAFAPGWLTGKLSDIAGLFFFPLLLALALSILADALDTEYAAKRLLGAGAALTAVVFGLVNTWPAFNQTLGLLWGPFTVDPTDLMCLPATWASYHWARSRLWRSNAPVRSPSLRAFAATLAAFASLATSPVPTMRAPRQFPYWESDGLNEAQLGPLRIAHSDSKWHAPSNASEETRDNVGRDWVEFDVVIRGSRRHSIDIEELALETGPPGGESASTTGSLEQKSLAVEPGEKQSIRALFAGNHGDVPKFVRLVTHSPELERTAALCLYWQAHHSTPRPLPCRATRDLRVVAWVVKSGKTGLGVLLRARNAGDHSRALRVDSAELRVGRPDGPNETHEPSHHVASEIPAGEHADLYLPFSFDNERAWNRGRYDGRLRLHLQLGEKEIGPWTIPLNHRRDQPHCRDSAENVFTRPHACTTNRPETRFRGEL